MYSLQSFETSKKLIFFQVISYFTNTTFFSFSNGQRVRRISSRENRADESRGGGVLKVCTLNVGSLIGRGREVVEMLARRKN